jgi:nitroreductase
MNEIKQDKSDYLYSRRRSLREFDDRIVPDEIVRELIEAAAWAPTSCNMQLYHFVIVNSPELLNKFTKPVTGKINWCKQMAVLLVDPDITFENQANYISAGMVVQNFLLRATELGIGTCPIAGFKGKEVLRKHLGIPDRYVIPLLIFFGYPKKEASNIHTPYRLPTVKTYSYNKFNGPQPFPTSSCVDVWQQSQIYDYRRRILSVYFPRFGHSIWGKSYSDAVWPYIAPHVGNDRRVLYIFPWERSLLDRLAVVSARHSLDIADADPGLLNFTQKSYPDIINNSIDIENDPPQRRYDTVLIIGSLEFNSNPAKLIDYAERSLNKNGNLIIASVSPLGILGIYLSLLRLFGRQRDVYHESLFYKLGPYKLFRKNYLNGLVGRSQHLRYANYEKVNTNYVVSKVKNKVLAKIILLLADVIKESGVYRFTKAD